MTENTYLRTKEKYIVEIRYIHTTRIREVFESFGIGTYWHVRDDFTAQQNDQASYEIWLAPEELTTIKIIFPTVWFLKIR